ncbi:MAG: bifunctional phosphopantothenoylcysteine decarboxylase/phosphopantothenate--cysteine ligase CoaBC [Rhodospirillaceae bacterium]|nr:bifunctional phosphopantothenoylcysteine decarboxylase/phosphopantothenate--cysteine ligase CoaBC [Rhodospirillaceae bacterium]MDD9916765.1 bifunctional phosphopantothenoylcysteine decarboxylase/phosphopantothenate--cysteine ligase CoaBC [Rhodospirillaceae bacterium]
MDLQGRRILLIISGGIAAFKSLDLIRRLREQGATVRCVLTKGGAQFVTPLSVSALSEEKVYQDIFSLTDEAEMGHINLSREADLLVVAPASADIMARMASGLASDLATTALLATDKPVMVVPAMNVRMWEHAATQANIETLRSRGVMCVGPVEGNMACGEYGYGRMSEVEDVVAAIVAHLAPRSGALAGRRAIVTSGPTHEAIDPVRYIANRSSGKQGHAIAAALAREGADTVLVSGPTALPDPAGVTMVKVESARDMLAACEKALPAEIAVCVAAVADWRVADAAAQKLKKNGGGPPPLELSENPDILRTLAKAGNKRPSLVIGFAAETENVVANAQAKCKNKNTDWILANDVSPDTGTFGGDANTIHLVDGTDSVESWPTMTKDEVADRLVSRIGGHFGASA